MDHQERKSAIPNLLPLPRTGERGRGEGALWQSLVPLSPDPSPPSTGERGDQTRFRFLIVNITAVWGHTAGINLAARCQGIWRAGKWARRRDSRWAARQYST